MKILFVSLPSIHAIRWIANLEDSNHTIYWFDVLGRGQLKSNVIPLKDQFVGWKQRKRKYIKGEFFLSKNFPLFYSKLEPCLQITASEHLEKIIHQIQPDVVHSFEMQSCSYPILKMMNKYPDIKWIYSCWGSDLFYYTNFNHHKRKIKKVLKRTDYLFTDCGRDVTLAKELGFKRESLGVLPGGSGYEIQELVKYREEIENREIISIKGYEHNFGRAINVLKALELIDEEIKDFKIVVYGAHEKVIDYIKKNSLNIKYFNRHELSHIELLKLMGKSKIHIGNSISDGIPNTLLESIIMGAFPIQSNPGRASEEYIINNINGLLISDPDDIQNISELISNAINSNSLIKSASKINLEISKKRLDKEKIKEQIIRCYNKISDDVISK